MDMSLTVAPKSDQINADDLIAGPRTITVTRVNANEGNAEQPVNVYFDGDNGKPFRPCKSMRRVMIAVWGVDAKEYVGRSMTLYRDPDVTWGGMKVGGIRISHMSHMNGEQVLALTATKSSRKPYKVRPLKVEQKAPDPEPETTEQILVDYVNAMGEAEEGTPLETAVRKMRAAHKSPKLDNEAWFGLYEANKDWLENYAPDAASALSTRGAVVEAAE